MDANKLKDRLVAIAALEEPDKSARLQLLCIDLFVESATCKLNITHLNDHVIPSLHSKITTLQQELVSLEEKRTKSETVVQNLKKLASELESQMESFLYKSKTTQLTMHQQRETLTIDFSKGVDSISSRLKELEVKKSNLNDEYKQLQTEFAECIHDYEAQEKEVAEVQSESQVDSVKEGDGNSVTDPSAGPPADSEQSESKAHELCDELNFEEENAMMFEDYRSQLHVLDLQEVKMQSDLALGVSKFQELSTGLLTSKQCLTEHHARVAELEKTLVSLEGQKAKGKKILKEINRVIDQEKSNCESIKTSMEATKVKLSRCHNMCSAFDSDIETLKKEISDLMAERENPPVE